MVTVEVDPVRLHRSLLQFVDDGIVVAGLPVLVSDQVDEDTVFWGIPEAARDVRAALQHHGRAVVPGRSGRGQA